MKYMPRTAIKSQALVDFINDWTKLQMPEEKPDSTYWTIHFDGSRQLEGSGAGVSLTSPRGDKFCYVLRLMFPCTNNAAEYEALLHGLRMAKEMNLSRVRCFGGSAKCQELGIQRTHSWWLITERLTRLLVISKVIKWSMLIAGKMRLLML